MNVKEWFNKIDYFRWIPLVLFGLYTLGFLIWNFYLSSLGISEFNFLQTRFLSAGVAFTIFVFLITVPVLLIRQFVVLLRKIFKKTMKTSSKSFGHRLFISYVWSIFFATVFGFYVIVIFPYIPQCIGGAKPVIASLLGAPEQMRFLSNFNISLSENADGKDPVQTEPLCVLYQNDDSILLGIQFFIPGPTSSTALLVNQRNVLLKSDQILGFQLGLENLRCVASDFYILHPKKVKSKIIGGSRNQIGIE